MQVGPSLYYEKYDFYSFSTCCLTMLRKMIHQVHIVQLEWNIRTHFLLKLRLRKAELKNQRDFLTIKMFLNGKKPRQQLLTCLNECLWQQTRGVRYTDELRPQQTLVSSQWGGTEENTETPRSTQRKAGQNVFAFSHRVWKRLRVCWRRPWYEFTLFLSTDVCLTSL